MKETFRKAALVLIMTTLFSCKSVIVSQPTKPNFEKVELNNKYEFHLTDSSKSMYTVTRIDENSIFIKDKNGMEKEILKTDVREIKKIKVGSSILLAIVSIAAVIFVPI